MSQMKRFAEQVSVEMGKYGEIDDEVLAEAQSRLKRLPSLRRRLELIDNPTHRMSIEQECVPNSKDCPKCDDTMDWDNTLATYECQACGHRPGSSLTPKECGECGRAWPWEKSDNAKNDGGLSDGVRSTLADAIALANRGGRPKDILSVEPYGDGGFVVCFLSGPDTPHAYFDDDDDTNAQEFIDQVHKEMRQRIRSSGSESPPSGPSGLYQRNLGQDDDLSSEDGS